MLPIAHSSALRSHVMRTVGAELAIIPIGQRDRPNVVRPHEAEGEEALRPAACENDALVEREESFDAVGEEVLHGEEFAGEMGAGTDGEEGGRVNAVVIGGGEVERDGEETAVLVCG